ncbi:ATP-binding cassette domain-containing protein [Flagellimonas taeanensis]|uniref:ATP-binding cassette domain-containing protein n=1 Tax=Flagellimonas taeanensis TaxID=1005926 RepID=UPI000E685405|nr:ATP-binding cassette domain-containing protein [Allomuricauda taeanensis]RIV51342.1 ATP-binding cassette domain-containing protein [Allomuricauda taeanensis]
MYSLQITNLVHHFAANDMVLDNINLEVPEGSIYGFLGPNGAGKTTTLKLILGLLKKQQGTITLFGKPLEKNRIDILKRVGSLIESPSLYGHLTAHENLNLLQKVYQCPKTNIQEVLNLVGLAHTGKKKAGQFSLGMKQRLSIAIALLHDPSLLILDEPTNGLDPNGMIEIRELLLKLNKEKGITIIISSHLLAEMERLVTHIGIINKGKLMFEGTLGELREKQQQLLSVILETDDNEKATRIIADNDLIPCMEEGRIVLPAISKDTVARINRQLVANGLEVYEIKAVRNDLEAIFMDFIKN